MVLSGFQEWTGSLQGVVTQALDHVKGQEASLTALKLAALTLGVGQAQTQVGRSGWVAVCTITDFVSFIQSMVLSLLTLPLSLHICLSPYLYLYPLSPRRSVDSPEQPWTRFRIVILARCRSWEIY